MTRPDRPSGKDLRRARDEYRALLERTTSEAEWQSFFASHPYVLSRSLPLRLDPSDIVPRGRPGMSEPDFIFYSKPSAHIPVYGVIELKRPDSRIVSTTRSDIAILSRDAETAVQQAQHYAGQSWSSGFRKQQPSEMLFLGSARYLFVIMGLSAQLAHLTGTSLLHDMLERRLPRDLQILPYDTLLARFEAGMRRRIVTLAVDDRIYQPDFETLKQLLASLSEEARVEFVYLYRSRIERWQRKGYENPYKDLLYTGIDYSVYGGPPRGHVVNNYEPDRYAEVIRVFGDDRHIITAPYVAGLKALTPQQRTEVFGGIEILDANDWISPD
jgi:antiviral defense system Shedu protein SduA